MGQLYLLSERRLIEGHPHRLRALAISICCHGLLIATVIGVACFYHPPLLAVPRGSASGGLVVTLQTMVIVSAPLQPPPRAQAAPVIAQVPRVTALPVPVVARTQPSPIGVAVLPAPATKPVVAKMAQALTPVPKVAVSHATGLSTSHVRPASAPSVSSYAPGSSVFPHPPYPSEARDRQQTGIVRMMVQFDTNGDVVAAEIEHSSGVAILDRETESFIREHWHSAAYAGKAVAVPVEYTLTSL